MSRLGANNHSTNPDLSFGDSKGADGADGINGTNGIDGLDADAVDVGAWLSGILTDSEKLLTFVVTRAFELPASLTGSQAYAEVTATAAATIDIQKNGVSIGSIDFAIATNVATFTFASLQSFAVGDRLSLVNQATADATLADVSATFKGTKV